MSERNFFAELKRRNVYKVAVAYAVVGLAADPARDAALPLLRNSELGDETGCSHHRGWISDCVGDRVGV